MTYLDTERAEVLALRAARESLHSNFSVADIARYFESAWEDAWDDWSATEFTDELHDIAMDHADSVPSVYSAEVWECWSTLTLWAIADELLEDLDYDQSPLGEIATSDGRRGLEAVAVIAIALAAERAIYAYCESMASSLEDYATELESL